MSPDHGPRGRASHHRSATPAVILSGTPPRRAVRCLPPTEHELHARQSRIRHPIWREVRSPAQHRTRIARVAVPVPLTRAPDRFSFAGGFLLAFVYNYLGMLALGLALESMITLLTPKFIPYFLFLLVRHPTSRRPISARG